MTQWMNSNDLNRVQGLLKYLNDSFGLPGEALMTVEIKVTDSNGDALGVIDFEENSERYVFYYGA